MLPAAATLEKIVSKPRLDSYRGYWKVSADAAVGLYMWNGEVCAETSKLLSYLEISLRNNIHRELSLSTTSGSSSSSHWWDALWGQLKADTKNKITAVRNKSPGIAPSPDEIVSRLSFGFWPNILAWIAKQQTILMPKILPAHPLSQAGATVTWWDVSARQDAVAHFHEFNDVRNRIAHHEPLWRFADVIDTSPPPPAPPILIAAASTDEASTLLRFKRLLALYDQAVNSLSSDLYTHITTSSWRARLDFLLTPRGLDRYKSGFHVAEASAISAGALSENFETVINGNRPVKLLDTAGSGLFIPS